jgi:hypothetical protein
MWWEWLSGTSVKISKKGGVITQLRLENPATVLDELLPELPPQPHKPSQAGE